MITQKFDLIPSNIDEAIKYAEIISKSDLVPKDYKGKPANVLVAVQMGLSLGLHPMQALQCIAVINGRPCIYGDGALARVRASGHLEYIKEENTDTKAVCVAKRKNEPEITYTFTIEEAQRAGLVARNPLYRSYPKRMLQMRARAFALRDAFADVLLGLSIAEEALDMPVNHDSDGVIKKPIDLLKDRLMEPSVKSVNAIEITHVSDAEIIDVGVDIMEESEVSPEEYKRLQKVDKLKEIINTHHITIPTIKSWLAKAQAENIGLLSSDILDKLITHYEGEKPNARE